MENLSFDSSIFMLSPEAWRALVPYLVLCIGLFVAILTAGFRASHFFNRSVALVVFSAFVVCSALELGKPEVEIFGTSLVINNFIRITSCIIGALACLGSLFVTDSRSEKMHSEWLAILIVHTLGLVLLPAASDFISFFIYMETFALTGYVMAALDTGREKSLEAGLKYLLAGAFASGFYLMGVALLFGATGQLSFHAVSEILRSDLSSGNMSLSLVGILFVVSSLLFKVGSVPFHMWAPDVYQASPTAMSSILATTGKVSVFAALGVLGTRVGFLEYTLVKNFLFWTGVLSVVVGSLGAISQRSIKRVLAYSGIVNAGYVTLALSLGASAMGSALVNLFIYSLTFIALMAIVERALAEKGSEPHGDILISEVGLSFKASNPLWAGFFAMLVFSTAGLPPLPGFFGKYLILKDIWAAGGHWQIFFVLLGTLLGLVYYLKVVVLLVLKDVSKDDVSNYLSNTGLEKTRGLRTGAVLAGGVAVVSGILSVWVLSGLSRIPGWVQTVELFAR
jgi:NADH-quinone oxidoreductase subunit N